MEGLKEKPTWATLWKPLKRKLFLLPWHLLFVSIAGVHGLSSEALSMASSNQESARRSLLLLQHFADPQLAPSNRKEPSAPSFISAYQLCNKCLD